MYIDYETYASLSTNPIASADFASAEAWAEAELDLWTLNRLHTIDWSEWKARVEVVMTKLIDSKTAIEEGESGSALSHFSNGQDTYTFAHPEENAAYKAIETYALDVLPVELISRVAHYNGAH